MKTTLLVLGYFAVSYVSLMIGAAVFGEHRLHISELGIPAKNTSSPILSHHSDYALSIATNAEIQDDWWNIRSGLAPATMYFRDKLIKVRLKIKETRPIADQTRDALKGVSLFHILIDKELINEKAIDNIATFRCAGNNYSATFVIYDAQSFPDDCEISMHVN